MVDRYLTDLGGWNSPFGSAQLSSVVFNGPYDVHDGMVERRVVLTNKTPVGAYRGYGQPEVNFAVPTGLNWNEQSAGSAITATFTVSLAFASAGLAISAIHWNTVK